jgi:hypothetical protein
MLALQHLGYAGCDVRWGGLVLAAIVQSATDLDTPPTYATAEPAKLGV